jgi:hypothetical protein
LSMVSPLGTDRGETPVRLGTIGAVLLALASISCARDRPVWFAPNLASRDMTRLFTHPEEWQEVRRRVEVFQFYAAQLGDVDECLECGGNSLPGFQAAGAFRRLAEWDVAAGMEAPAVKEWSCGADAALSVVRRLLVQVRAAGGEIRFVAIDEPLLGGERCGQERAVTADTVAWYHSSLRTAFPTLGIGDVEPYPHFEVEAIVEWLDALISRGVPVAFFHLDVDRVLAAARAKDVAGDLIRLRAACRERRIPFGVIFWGGDGLDESGYARDVLSWVDVVRQAVGVPTHVVFQSWSVSPDGRREVPVNLPEDSREVWTHTRLVAEGLRRLDDS